MFKIGYVFVLVLAGLSIITLIARVAWGIREQEKESERRAKESMRMNAIIAARLAAVKAEELSVAQRNVRRFNNGRYEWITEGGKPDFYSLMASNRMHEFMSERYKRVTATNCPNCGAPYTGKDACEYCGTMLQKETYRV